MAAAATRSKTEVYLLGSTLTELTGNKLPSLRQVRYWFVFTSPSSTKTNYPTVIGCYSRKLAILYQMARIQMMDPRNCITKVERTFKEWRLLKKNKGRQSVTQQANEAEFLCKLDDLFDIWVIPSQINKFFASFPLDHLRFDEICIECALVY